MRISITNNKPATTNGGKQRADTHPLGAARTAHRWSNRYRGAHSSRSSTIAVTFVGVGNGACALSAAAPSVGKHSR